MGDGGPDVVGRPEGCPVCGWGGEVARTHDSSHRYYTHIVEQDSEVAWGRTCSMRTRPRKRSLLSRFFGLLRPQEAEDHD